MSYLLLALAGLTALAGTDDELRVTQSVVRVEGKSGRLTLGDVDGDRDQDLIAVSEDGLTVRLQGPDGGFAEEASALLPWPGENLVWTLVDTDGDGTIELAVFLEAREVRSYALDRLGEDGGPGAGRIELEARGHLPRGLYRMSFFRDVDGDGRLDLVLPGFGSYAVHLRSEDGAWAAPVEVKLEASVDYDVGDPDQLDSDFGQEVRIPWFSLEDVDGDGDPDLVAETEDEVLFHLAEPRIATEPTWRLDLAALRAELPGDGEVDFDDLLASAGRTVGWKIADLDGAKPDDLVLQLGSKFRVYHGGSRTGPVGAPDQVLKSSGSVLTFLLRDVQGDALPDLQLIRGERLSVARILRWLIIPGGLDFELFTYENTRGTFSRRPTRRNTLAVEFPRLLALIDEIEEMEDELDEQQSIPAVRVALQGDGASNDVLDIDGRELFVFRDRVPDEEADETPGDGEGLTGVIEASLLRDIDEMPDGATKTFDLGDFADWNLSPGAALREACSGLEPDQRIPLAEGLDEAQILTRDLDGDGRSDFLVVGKLGEDWVVQLLVRQPAPH